MAAKRRKNTARAGRTTPRSRTGGTSRPAGNPPRAASPSTHPAHPGVITIRKYANRRLYDSAASAHITQEDLYRMVGRGAVVRILDASTGEDITNQTLALALIEHDPAKLRLVPTWLLHQMIRLHEQALGGWLGSLWQAAGAANPNLPWPALGSAWPGSGALGSWPAWLGGGPAAAPDADAADRGGDIEELRGELDRLLRRLNDLEKRG